MLSSVPRGARIGEGTGMAGRGLGGRWCSNVFRPSVWGKNRHIIMSMVQCNIGLANLGEL